MKKRSFEQGQALILIVFAIIALVGMTALTIDGGNAYSDRRNAQNAADSSALAAALANSRGNDPTTAARSLASINGYNNNGTSNVVSVTIENSPSGACPGNQSGKDITVEITSHLRTYFAPVVGISQVTNKVTATGRSCDSYVAPLFNGNAIVSLAPSGIDFDAKGTPDWTITGGGIFSNSSSANSVSCGGSADVSAPSITTVGTEASRSCFSPAPAYSSGAAQYAVSDYAALLPRAPACNGTATKTGGVWYPQAGADGSKVAFSGDMVFSTGLYCVTNSPGPFHNQITGNAVTFYIMPSNFSMKFNGGGNLTARAPTGNGEYKGVLMFSAPQVSGGTLLNTQALDMRGNGTGDVVGSIIMPSAAVTMFGNSGTAGFDSQIIAYQVDSGGNANIKISYNAGNNYQPPYPFTLSLVK